MVITADHITPVRRPQRGPMQRAEWRNRVLHVCLLRIGRVDDRYGSDVLARDPHSGRKVRSAELPIELGMVVEDAQTGYVGAVVRVEYGRMELEDRHGRTKPFPIGPGYLVDGKPVILTAPRRPSPDAVARTASGSVAGAGNRARVAPAGAVFAGGRPATQ